MLLLTGVFWGIAALELAVLLLHAGPAQRWLAAAVGVFVIISTAAVLWGRPGGVTVLVAWMSAYRLVNLLRLARPRMHVKYLRRMSMQAGLWIVGLQGVVWLLWWLGSVADVTASYVWQFMAFAGAGSALVLLSSTMRHIRTTRPPQAAAVAAIGTHLLPTLTVAIPARNETDDLEACLTSLIASDYPKLEILVLDDCSQNRRTPEIIRAYAHEGVRFLQGAAADENWLAKNYAYQQLLEAANGELMLFCGVDVRFAPGSLRQLVASMLHKNKTMLSVMPYNEVPFLFRRRGSMLLQPMRYAWELALPRKLFRRPPVLSTCWLARRELLASAGGFGAVSRSIVPESYFARTSAVHDGYSFMRSSPQIGVMSVKTIAEQRETVLRTRYPQVHRRIDLVMILAFAELGGVLLPYVLLALGLLGRLPLPATLASAAAVVMLSVAYAATVTVTYRVWLARALAALPVAIIADVLLLHRSMAAYEFFSVLWKGRNVCMPVMHVVPQLPETAAHPHA